MAAVAAEHQTYGHFSVSSPRRHVAPEHLRRRKFNFTKAGHRANFLVFSALSCPDPEPPQPPTIPPTSALKPSSGSLPISSAATWMRQSISTSSSASSSSSISPTASRNTTRNWSPAKATMLGQIQKIPMSIALKISSGSRPPRAGPIFRIARSSRPLARLSMTPWSRSSATIHD